MTDILDQIDQAIGCQQCGKPFPEDPKEHVSDDFCGPDCQQAWHFARSAGEIPDGGRGARDIWQETMDAIDMLPRSLWSGRINIATLAYPAQGGCAAGGCGSDAPWVVSVRSGRWVVHEMKICDEHQAILEDRIRGPLVDRQARLRRLAGMVALRSASNHIEHVR